MSGFSAAIESARALVPVAGGPPVVRPPPRLPGPPDAGDLPWLRLWQAVEARLPDRPRKVVQIAACAEGEADPAVAARLARLVGRATGGGVVVLNDTPEAEGNGQPVAFGPLPGRGGDPRALDPRALAAYWRLLLRQARLVIVDTPPVLASPLALAMAPTVDGVILVIEAECTRAAIADAARRALGDCGANLLGVVLNKRRFHVPGRLYRWL